MIIPNLSKTSSPVMVNLFLLLLVCVFLSSSTEAHDEHEECINGGKLMADGSCFCPANFYGSRCQTLKCPVADESTCDSYKSTHCSFDHIKKSTCPNKCGICPNYCSKPCQNGGELNSLECSCDCPKGYSGDLCQDRDCSYQTCLNGGVVNPTTCECICPSSGVFSGEHCENVNCTHCTQDPPTCDPEAKCLICNNKLLAPTCPHLCDMCSPPSNAGTTTISPSCSCTCTNTASSGSTTASSGATTASSGATIASSGATTAAGTPTATTAVLL